jgi:hypothetical protein
VSNRKILSKNINPSPEILGAMIPEIQQQFMNGLAEYAAKYQASPNAVQKFLLRQKRQQFLAEQLKDRVLTKWIGRIRTLLTTSNGKAYLEIELAMVPPVNATENKLLRDSGFQWGPGTMPTQIWITTL